MRYAIKIKRQAKRKLLTLPDKVRLRIVDAITQLGTDVDDPELDTKQLQASKWGSNRDTSLPGTQTFPR